MSFGLAGKIDPSSCRDSCCGLRRISRSSSCIGIIGLVSVLEKGARTSYMQGRFCKPYLVRAPAFEIPDLERSSIEETS